jgi:stage V sporulation protein G
VQPVGQGRLLALASVELVIEGITLVLHGVQVVRLKHPVTGQEATGVDLPRYRAPDGTWRPAIDLPPELRKPLGDAVLAHCCELGITQRVISRHPTGARKVRPKPASGSGRSCLRVGIL